MPNPFNSACTLTMCNGIYSHGVYGAVRSLTDTQLQNANERYIAENFSDQEFCILMRVRLVGGRVVTPDFGTKGTILYQWPLGASA
jgi:hypothetical protein